MLIEYGFDRENEKDRRIRAYRKGMKTAAGLSNRMKLFLSDIESSKMSDQHKADIKKEALKFLQQ